MAGCTLLITGIPDPLPSSPIFLYLDKNGKPVPPPNYVRTSTIAAKVVVHPAAAAAMPVTRRCKR